MPLSRLLLILGAVLGLLAGGCSRDQPLEPVSLEEIPTLTTNLFGASPPEIRQAAFDAAEALRAGRPTVAWGLYNRLASAPNLTEEQRRFAARALTAASEAMAKAAESGDSEAARMQRAYGASK